MQRSDTTTPPSNSVNAELQQSRTSLARKFFAPVDGDFLVYFRVLFGLMMLWQVLSYFAVQSNGCTILTNYYIRPFHFTYYGFGWIRPWPGEGMIVHFVLMAVLALGILLGFMYRLCAVLFCLGWVYFFLLDKAYYQNHYYLICLLSGWMAILPANREFSLDVSRRPELRATSVPAWMLWGLRLQIGIPYFFGGIAKINHDWLHGEPMRRWIYDSPRKYEYVRDILGWWYGEDWRREWVVYFFAYGGLLFDLLVVPALLWRRTRWIACAAVLFFHFSNFLTYPIGIFPWLMLGSTLLFFPAGTLRRLTGGWADSKQTMDSAEALPVRQRFVVGTLVAYFAFQFLWPLRHHLYPGDAGWTGEGDLFSWRMMLYTKSGEPSIFELHEPESRATPRQIDCREFLNPQQAWSMQLSPDLVLQFAHFLHEKLLVPNGLPHWEVRARVPVSYNGRRFQLLVDPTVNLAAIPREAWGNANWITPLTEPLPEARHPRSSPAKDDVGLRSGESHPIMTE